MVIVDSERDRQAQQAMLSRANMSLSVLEKSFIRNGSGRYVVLRAEDQGAIGVAPDAVGSAPG